MAVTFTDMPIEALRAYRPALAEPAGLDAFWTETLSAARAEAGPTRLAAVEGPVRSLSVSDLTFTGFDGDEIRGWVVRPHGDEVLPAVVEYIGYGGGRGLPGERLTWAAAGYVHVIMDTRGQGSSWSLGATPDPHGSAAAYPGVMTRGILDPRDYYYRRLYTDAVRLVDEVRAMPGVDADRVAVTGTSQGGGLAIAAAALSGEAVAAVMPDVPFLCDFPNAIVRTPSAPFSEITRFLSVHRDEVDRVLHTLSHVDGAVLARRIHVPAYFSVALMDDVVLPSGVFAAFHALASDDAAIEEYTYNGHEGGGHRHWMKQVAWLDARFGR
ncbi:MULTISPECIES: acetylxylan esterase [Microbacterium]|uniref:acetylxylan esterase n=1 Tax=Microbacterium TaxID=33882 RepID=UPI00278BADC9|nr:MULTISPECIES: acetylxylan esterase [Microbacterium]MDQ1085281.1 cephalosporin-C deacetylase [Microbacterium sp. SORGH_AS_0344]MDQ1169412.1 cephalosporin-C deacetylase [Microbacterium proteolyticum]